MDQINLEQAQAILAAALADARARALKPLAVSVLDARGALRAFAAEDGASLRRGEIALGKANGALALGLGSRALMRRAEEQPSFIAAVTHVAGGSLIPVPGGVLIRAVPGGPVIGVIGISGDTSDNDEIACLAGIKAVGLLGDPG
jgi:uncharacterized protein GlcG (DUF336 family)